MVIQLVTQNMWRSRCMPICFCSWKMFYPLENLHKYVAKLSDEILYFECNNFCVLHFLFQFDRGDHVLQSSELTAAIHGLLLTGAISSVLQCGLIVQRCLSNMCSMIISTSWKFLTKPKTTYECIKKCY